MLFLKTFKDVKFTVDGSAFQTFITLSTKNFCLMLAVHLVCFIRVYYRPGIIACHVFYRDVSGRLVLY